MIKVDVQQNSLEWLVARAGLVTASEFDNIVTPKFESRKGQMPKTYMALKLAERWTGGPMPGAMTLDMESGKILEEVAVPWWNLEMGPTIERVGLCKTDDGRLGCSPDGLLGEDSGIEIKAPLIKTHISYLLAGIVPEDYLPQVHGAMLVTGRPRWVFMSFCRTFINAPLIVTVERDEEIQRKLSDALIDFLVKFEFEWNRLCEMNGGEPVRRPITRPTPQPAEENFDLIP